MTRGRQKGRQRGQQRGQGEDRMIKGRQGLWYRTTTEGGIRGDKGDPGILFGEG